MCTVTFIPRKRGYVLGMNRDEKRTRAKGLPPAKRKIDGRQVTYPSEPSGGTWIALNDHGVTLALINWYSIAARVGGKAVSRGKIINSISTVSSADFADAGLALLPLDRINPFRLIAVFPMTREVVEWRWNLTQLAWKTHRWQTRQWASSGFNEPTAQRVRGRTFRQAQKQESAGSLGWLRRLHRSHLPEVGPRSICMHRADAATVSYTEISVSRLDGTMRYHPGAPCKDLESSCVQGLVFSRRITPPF